MGWRNKNHSGRKEKKSSDPNVSRSSAIVEVISKTWKLRTRTLSFACSMPRQAGIWKWLSGSCWGGRCKNKNIDLKWEVENHSLGRSGSNLISMISQFSFFIPYASLKISSSSFFEMILKAPTFSSPILPKKAKNFLITFFAFAFFLMNRVEMYVVTPNLHSENSWKNSQYPTNFPLKQHPNPLFVPTFRWQMSSMPSKFGSSTSLFIVQDMSSLLNIQIAFSSQVKSYPKNLSSDMYIPLWEYVFLALTLLTSTQSLRYFTPFALAIETVQSKSRVKRPYPLNVLLTKTEAIHQTSSF